MINAEFFTILTSVVHLLIDPGVHIILKTSSRSTKKFNLNHFLISFFTCGIWKSQTPTVIYICSLFTRSLGIIHKTCLWCDTRRIKHQLKNLSLFNQGYPQHSHCQVQYVVFRLVQLTDFENLFVFFYRKFLCLATQIYICFWNPEIPVSFK